MTLDSKKKWNVGIRRYLLYSWPFFMSLLVFLSTRVSIRHPGFIEQYYSNGVYPFIAKLFSSFSNLIRFSLWDVFWLLVIFLTTCGLILAVIKKIRFGWYILHVAQLVAILYSLFYILWGYNYFRPNIEKRIGWRNPKADESVFRSVLDTLIAQSNSNYLIISSSDYSKIDSLVEASYLKNSSGLGINYPNGSRRPKTMLFSDFFLKSGVSGYFGPFFNEIHVNHYLLPIDYPFLLAHEKAHQFGITSEAEANLAAFVICIKSDDKRLKYSGYQSLLLYLLKDASKMKEYRDYLSRIDKMVIGDLRFRQKYYGGKQNKTLSKMQTAANNSYLKVNHIEKGVLNYNQVVSLVMSWYNNSNNY
jgi:hypothetical protein